MEHPKGVANYAELPQANDPQCSPCLNDDEGNAKRKLGKKRRNHVLMVYMGLCGAVALVNHFSPATAPAEICRGAFYTFTVAMIAAWLSFVPETPARVGSDDTPDFYADTRALACCCGVPNSFDTLSNAGLVFAGAHGLWMLSGRDPNNAAGVARLRATDLICWSVMNCWIFVGGFCSAWYHLKPLHRRLAADRGPIAGGMVTFVVALIVAREATSVMTCAIALVAANVFGLYTVGVFLFQRHCRAYYFAQYGMIAIAFAAALLLPTQPSKEGVWVIIALYAFAKLMEDVDSDVFKLLCEQVSGHTIKHLVAGLAVVVLNMYLVKRGAI